MSERKYGWIPDVPDHRDIPYSEIQSHKFLSRMMRPNEVYHADENYSELFDQLNIGSCVGNAIAQGLSYSVDFNYDPLDGIRPKAFSRLFIYYIGRRNKLVDEGCYIREAMKAVARYGAPYEVEYPYVPDHWWIEPPKHVYDSAARRSGTMVYYRLTTLNEILDCIAQGYPVIFGMTVYPYFSWVSPNGMVRMPREDDVPVGGHAMIMVGYSMKMKHVFVRNSWGPNWGKEGYCFIPFEYIEKLASDFWTIRSVTR